MSKTVERKSTPARVQYGALPYRWTDASMPEVLLVTSRETKRWVIPKGWPKKRKDPWTSAASEAREEAGVVGSVKKTPIGSYSYRKRLRSGRFVVCDVKVYPLQVKHQQDNWREKNQRDIAWFSPEDAASAVQEPTLSLIIRDFSHRMAARDS
jgi:8-oxo-dGTP pyrophosphatase MutT (NUDIX family)